MIEPRAAIALMEGYHSPQLDVEVRLNTNESPEPPPEAFREALHAILDTIDWNRYPDRTAASLRQGLADLHGVAPEQVFVANGSNEVLECLLLAFGGPGRTAAVWEPTYALHSHISRLTGTAVAEGERAEDLSLDPGEVRRVFDDASPSVAFLCSPNNPTGMVEAPGLVQLALDLATDRGALLVIDEAYGQFASWSALTLVDEGRPAVVTRTFSKTWSMAGARLGYLIGPSSIVEQCWKVALPYHVDAFKQAVGVAALGFVAEMEGRVSRVIEERGRLVGGLTDLAVDLWPSDANFLLFRPRELDGDLVWRQLVARGVLVRNCSSWPRLDGCLRVTVGTRGENDTFLSAITEILR